MYIQPPGVSFSGTQGVSQPLLPPPPPLQYYPPVSIPSTLPQVRHRTVSETDVLGLASLHFTQGLWQLMFLVLILYQRSISYIYN